MADGKHSHEVDILALLAEVHGTSPEMLREERVAAALNTLEVTHRGAAQALRDLNTAGLRRKNLPGAAVGAAGDVPGEVGQGARAAALPPATGADAGPEPAAQKPPQAAVKVQSGEGADVALDARTLTHIVRPNRGRR